MSPAPITPPDASLTPQDSVRDRLLQLSRLQYGTLDLSSRYLLSPLAGYTNLPFRRIVREIGGVGLATTDLVNARGLLDGSPKSWQLIETCPEDRPFAVQIFGGDPVIMRDAAQLRHGALRCGDRVRAHVGVRRAEPASK